MSDHIIHFGAAPGSEEPAKASRRDVVSSDELLRLDSFAKIALRALLDDGGYAADDFVVVDDDTTRAQDVANAAWDIANEMVRRGPKLADER